MLNIVKTLPIETFIKQVCVTLRPKLMFIKKSVFLMKQFFSLFFLFFSVVAMAQDTTSLDFPELEYDFGTIKQGDVVNHDFNFKNTGIHQFKFSSVAGSCGCTVPKYNTDFIQPGAKDVIHVQFNSAGKMGDQVKTVTLNGNMHNGPIRLILKGKVTPNEQQATAPDSHGANDGHNHGAPTPPALKEIPRIDDASFAKLAKTSATLSQKSIDFGAVEKGKVYNRGISIVNTGKTPLYIKEVIGNTPEVNIITPATPIEPGKSESLLVNCNLPASKKATLTLVTNTKKTLKIKVKGNVKAN